MCMIMIIWIRLRCHCCIDIEIVCIELNIYFVHWSWICATDERHFDVPVSSYGGRTHYCAQGYF